MVWFGLVSSFNGISTFMGYLMSKPSFSKNSSDAIYPIAKWDERVHTFLREISSEVNVITWLEFKLIYYDVTVQYISHCTMRTPPPLTSETGCRWYCHTMKRTSLYKQCGSSSPFRVNPAKNNIMLCRSHITLWFWSDSEENHYRQSTEQEYHLPTISSNKLDIAGDFTYLGWSYFQALNKTKILITNW